MGELPDQREHIIRNLEELNRRVKTQMGVAHIFRNSVISGMGFIIGSTILTAAVVSVGLQFFGDTVFGDVIRWIARSR